MNSSDDTHIHSHADSDVHEHFIRTLIKRGRAQTRASTRTLTAVVQTRSRARALACTITRARALRRRRNAIVNSEVSICMRQDLVYKSDEDSRENRERPILWRDFPPACSSLRVRVRVRVRACSCACARERESINVCIRVCRRSTPLAS